MGVWSVTPATGATITYTSLSSGIEQLVASQIISPPSGNPLLAVYDFPVFTLTNPSQYPSQHGPIYGSVPQEGYSLDYATGTPTKIALYAQNGFAQTDVSSNSANGGGSDGAPSNWTAWTGFSQVTDFTGNGGGSFGGCIAAGSTNNFVIQLGNDFGSNNNAASGLWVTTDGGANWTSPTIAGIDNQSPGWQWRPQFIRHILCADKASTGIFYAYTAGGPFGSSTAGVYKSTNSGSSWSLVHSGIFDTSNASQFNATMLAVPGQAGNLFYTSGQQAPLPGTPQIFHRSIDSGTTWTTVTNVTNVFAFGFGKAKPGGGGYPAIYIYGQVSGTFGLYRSDDNAATWTLLTGIYPINSLDEIMYVSGDNNTYGTVYLGFKGSGFAYGTLS